MQHIKIKKDTPFHKAGESLSIYVFLDIYNHIKSRISSHDELEVYLKNLPPDLSEWFEYVETPKFKVGDWVWNNRLNEAFCVVIERDIKTLFYPNYATIDAVNENPAIYSRYATRVEIDKYQLHSVGSDGNILVGKYKCYYFDNTWKELKGVNTVVSNFLKIKPSIGEIDLPGNIYYKAELNGIKIGCKYFSNEEIIRIAQILGIE